MDVLIDLRILLRRVALAGAALLLSWTASAAAQPTEQAVKSVYLFKFADYVEWPEGRLPPQDQPFVIGVLGQDPLGAALDEAVAGRTVAGRPIEVRRLARCEDAASVHALYVSAVREDGRNEIATALEGRGVLTVSDAGAEVGAIIEFVPVNGRVRFRIDADAARKAGLRLRSELLALALSVRGRR